MAYLGNRLGRVPVLATLDWRSRSAFAYAALGRRPAALALAREELELARRYGAPRAIGIALRTLGAIADELERLEEAVEVLGASPARLEHAYALADLGVEPLAERARTELATALAEE
jgi:tetratricopeptide (TPR) repeat protein